MSDQWLMYDKWFDDRPCVRGVRLIVNPENSGIVHEFAPSQPESQEILEPVYGRN